VRLIGANELIFPVYDGNGMYLSLGNLATTRNVGLLFIDFQMPRRLRVQGSARILPQSGLTNDYPGAQHVVSVLAASIYVNCGRYIHRTGALSYSPHVPDAAGRQPFPLWKRIDKIADSLNEKDQREVAKAGGPIELESYRGEE